MHIQDENIVIDIDNVQTWVCDFGAAEFEGRANFRQFQGILFSFRTHQLINEIEIPL